jgi:two-component sensor histidine kinase
VIGPDGEYLGFQSTGRDITAQKDAEDRIHRLLEERELLLREVHHRVKNDLNFVYSLLSLQASQTTQTAAQQALSEAGDRVRVLTGIYDTLTARDTTTAVSLQPLIETVTDNLSHATLPEYVTVTRTLAEITVPVRLSVSIGIIYNELITNSAKYAVSSSQSDTPASIAVNLDHQETPPAVVLAVSDSGPGFPAEVLNRTRYGFGLTVVESLVSQHNGTLVLENVPGARITVTLPLTPQT